MRILQVAAAGLLLSSALNAQDTEPNRQKHGFFRATRVSFWRDTAPPSKNPLPPPRPASIESIWAEPMRTPSGETRVYVPPPQVLKFLDNPTEENAKAYLAWKQEKHEKMQRAIQILARVTAAARPAPLPAALEEIPEASTPERKPEAPEPTPRIEKSGTEILYFKKDGCPHCRRQDRVLSDLKSVMPAVPVRVLSPEDAPELWAAYDVTVVPTLIVTRPDGTKARARGFTPLAALVTALSKGPKK